MGRLRVAVVGVGHLGKEHARILAGLPEAELVGVVDAQAERAQAVAERCGTRAYDQFWPLLNLVDAAVVAVPTVYHFPVAVEFLRRGIPLLVEKPLAHTLDQAAALVEVARQRQTLLQVGHIERFNPAFEELQRRSFQPKFLDCERLGPYTGRSTDIGVVLDLMIHDLDVVRTLVAAPLRSVEAVGATVFGGNEDLANARLTFTNGCVANITANRSSPEPRRQMLAWGPEGFVHLDWVRRRLRLIQPASGEGFPAGRLDVLDLDCNQGDQLTRELQHFLHCVRTGTRPRVSGEDGRDAIALAARVLECIRQHQWEGRADGPAGPNQLPAPHGPLFQPAPGQAAA